jgi:lysophospholipase L1-like esterase
MSDALRAYLEQNTLVRFTYNIDGDGLRRTVPDVPAERKILMVGDSALFGVGVDDDDTIASQVQRLVGASHRVVNGGVGGYDGGQAFGVARSLSDRDTYEILVYVAHNNDFYEPRHISNVGRARRVFEHFATLADRFPGGIHVALITYLEYTAEQLLGSSGWREERVRSLDRLREELPRLAAEEGFSFVDWSDLVAEIAAREKTSFAPWSLYVDHAHLSPRGNRILAEHIHAALPLPKPAAAQRR